MSVVSNAVIQAPWGPHPWPQTKAEHEAYYDRLLVKPAGGHS